MRAICFKLNYSTLNVTILYLHHIFYHKRPPLLCDIFFHIFYITSLYQVCMKFFYLDVTLLCAVVQFSTLIECQYTVIKFSIFMILLHAFTILFTLITYSTLIER